MCLVTSGVMPLPLGKLYQCMWTCPYVKDCKTLGTKHYNKACLCVTWAESKGSQGVPLTGVNIV